MDAALVDQFLQVTHTNDRAEAEHYLEACGGDVQAAVELYFQNPSTSAPQNGVAAGVAQYPSGAQANGGDHPPEDSVRAPIPPTSGVLLEQSYGQSYGARARRTPTDSVFDRFRDFRAESRAQYAMLSGEALKKAENKKKTLESIFRPPLDLLHAGNWESAREAGRTENRWLLVNVQNMQEFACQALNRDIWSNEGVRELVRANFVLWQVYSDSADGRRFANFYRVDRFPFVAIIDPRTGELITTVRTVDAVSFCDAVSTFLADTPSFTSWDQRMTSVSVSTSASMSSESSSSTSASSSAKKRSADGPLSSSPSYKSARVDDDESSSSQDMPDLEKLVAEKAKEENMNGWKHFSGDTGKDITVLFRFPDGKRERCTLKESSQLQALILFAESRGFPAQTHDLVTSFPKRELSSLDPECSLQQLEFGAQQVIHVERK